MVDVALREEAIAKEIFVELVFVIYKFSSQHKFPVYNFYP